tara:strand:- start:82 stop:408 length:327 start_codon:yes stop_codon:yes gene_type:complete
MLKNFSDDLFETEIKKEEISIIKFSAEWCGPCKSLAPILDSLSSSSEYSDKNISWYHADVETDAINTASAMGIRGVPTTIVYRAGVEVDRLVGNPGEARVREFVDKNL